MTLRSLIFSVLTLAILGLAAVAPVSAVPLACEIKCTPSTPSYIACSCGWGPTVTTCGDWRAFGCGLFLTSEPAPVDSDLPTTVLAELGIVRWDGR